MMESGDSIRGMALDAGFPLLLVVGYRGWTRHGVVRDSGARYGEPSTFPITIGTLSQMGFGWWSWRDSNPLPLQCH